MGGKERGVRETSLTVFWHLTGERRTSTEAVVTGMDARMNVKNRFRE